MPTYQYECGSCGYSFEAMQSITEKKLQECPACKKSDLQRLIGTGGGFIFKGSGFYETDYKKKQESPKTCPMKDSASCASNCPAKKAD